jgi:hypothetical protein
MTWQRKIDATKMPWEEDEGSEKYLDVGETRVRPCH